MNLVGGLWHLNVLDPEGSEIPEEESCQNTDCESFSRTAHGPGERRAADGSETALP
jgi:hypothetical protein